MFVQNGQKSIPSYRKPDQYAYQSKVVELEARVKLLEDFVKQFAEEPTGDQKESESTEDVKPARKPRTKKSE